MNDLTISRSEISVLKLASKTPGYPSLAIDANDLSFRKIQAASEPLLSKLKNANLIAEINWVAQEFEDDKVALSTVDNQGKLMTLFFGSVFVSGSRATPGELNLRVRVGKTDEDWPAYHSIVSNPHVSNYDQAASEFINANVTNSIILEVSLTGSKPVNNFFAVGFVVTLKSPLPLITQNFLKPLGAWVTDPTNPAYALTSGSLSQRGTLNFWDASSAPNGVPSFLKPKKVAHDCYSIEGVRTRVVGNQDVRIRPIAGTIIPMNFYAYLQYVHSILEGSQLQPRVNPIEMTGIATLIQDIAFAVDMGAVTLGSDPTSFVVPSFDFNEAIEAGNGLEEISSTAIFGFDPVETGTIALNHINTARRITGNAAKVVALFYPLSTLGTAKPTLTLACDLIQLKITNLTCAIPMQLLPSISMSGYTELVPVVNHRSLSQYACGFKYPTPIVNLT